MMGDSEDKATFSLDFIKTKSPSGSEDVHYSFFYEGIPEEYKLYAQNVLNETEDNKEKGIKKLRAFIEKEELPQCTDYEIIGVLRCTKYDIKKAETKLRKYLKFRQMTIKALNSMDEKKADYILDDVVCGFLPYRDKHGRAIAFTRPNLRFDLYHMDDIQPIVFASVLYMLSFPLTTLCGASYISENKTDNLFLFYPILKGYRPYINLFLNLPLRQGRADVLNENILINWFAKGVCALLPSKLRERLHFHGKSYEKLKEIYHPDILPEDFGGNLEPISKKYLKERLLSFIEKFKSENNDRNTQMDKVT